MWQKISLIRTCKKVSKQKSDHHHRILPIRNSLGIKFQRKLKVLNFWVKLTKKGASDLRKEKPPPNSTFPN